MSRLKLDIVGRESRYECEDLDAGLELHAHRPGSGLEHDVHCVEGAILVYKASGWYRIVNAGETLVFDTTLWHGIVPVLLPTRFVNTSGVDPGSFSSVLDSPHNAPPWVLVLRAAWRYELDTGGPSTGQSSH